MTTSTDATGSKPSTGHGKPSATLVVSIVSLVFFAAAVIAGAIVTGNVNERTTPLITAVLALVGTAIPGIMALYRTEQNQNELRNGVITEKVTDALAIHAAEQGGALVTPRLTDSTVPDGQTPDYANNSVKEGE